MKKNNKIMGGWVRIIIFDFGLWITLAVSMAIAFMGNEEVLRAARTDVGIAQVSIGTAILGIVLAGLAILIVFLDEKYIKLLEQLPPGIKADLWVFKFVALISIICAAFGMLLILIGYPPTSLFRTILGLSLWSFSYLLWLLFDLVKFVIGHAKVRVKQIQKKMGNQY